MHDTSNPPQRFAGWLIGFGRRHACQAVCVASLLDNVEQTNWRVAFEPGRPRLPVRVVLH